MLPLTYRATHHPHELLMKLRKQYSEEVFEDEDFQDLDQMAYRHLEKIHHVIEDSGSHS